MNKLIAIALLAAALPAGADAAPSGVAQVDAQWAKAFKAGDVDAVTACYAADAVAWVAGAPIAKGSREISEQYKAYFAAYTIKSVSLHEIGSSTVGADSVGWGSFSITAVAKAGGPVVTEVGRYTEVARKLNGKWVYAVDHASDEPAPEPAAK